MTPTRLAVSQGTGNELEGLPSPCTSTIDRILSKLSGLELPEKEHVERYLRHKWRLNHKPNSLKGSFKAIDLFLTFYAIIGKNRLEDIIRDDLEAFIEHEQDRGTKISSARARLKYLLGFLRYLMDENIVPEALFRRRIRLKLPDVLPRAINPSDMRKLVSVIDHTRDKALILVLLTTGMRIGEALRLKLHDVDMKERKIQILEGEKNACGRMVYLSDDALFALKRWFLVRQNKELVFYARCSEGMCYTAARARFVKYLKKAGIEHKGYTVHSLRHTFASELLNAGMRLECLQQLLGHHNIEITRRYARLTDTTREEEYFRAMAIIEKGGVRGDY
jgi:site-specific recombinase XerD